MLNPMDASLSWQSGQEEDVAPSTSTFMFWVASTGSFGASELTKAREPLVALILSSFPCILGDLPNCTGSPPTLICGILAMVPVAVIAGLALLALTIAAKKELSRQD